MQHKMGYQREFATPGYERGKLKTDFDYTQDQIQYTITHSHTKKTVNPYPARKIGKLIKSGINIDSRH